MTRDYAVKILPIIQAIADGKPVQKKDKYISNVWEDVDELDNINIMQYEYRVKSQPTYRPFKKAKECWDEMQKHQPFGWIRRVDDDGNEYYTNRGIDDFTNYEYYFDNFTFVDGTPFGVKE